MNQFYQWVKRTLAIQAIIAICVGTYFYYNYENITKSKSISEQIENYKEHTAAPVQAAHVIASTQDGQEDLQYQWLFGAIQVASKTEWDTLQNTTKSIQTIDISQDSIDAAPYVMHAVENGTIDGNLARYLIGKWLATYNQFLQDLPIINNYLLNSLSISNQASATWQELYTLIQSKDYKWLVAVLQSIENAIPAPIGIMSLQTNFTADEEFQYLFSKIYVDEDNMYRDHIQSVATLFGIDPNIMRAAIMTEQIRWFYTYRWYIKNIIKSNKFIMVMSQMSYGIWGIKEATAMRIEEYFYTNYPDIYSTYFIYPEWYLPTQYTNARISRLTQTNDFYYQILYIWGLIKMILDNWTNAGVDIASKPGIILTLYNFGDKEVNPDPQVGGAEIEINGTNYSFGALGMILYYIMEVYG
jgi:hypothetical protein